MSYNGWSNYETWNVKLWMDNDGEDEFWEERARELVTDELTGGSGTKEEVQEAIDTVVGHLADAIKDQYDENMPDVSGTYEDLLRAALQEVDWSEIASSILDNIDFSDITDEEEEEEE